MDTQAIIREAPVQKPENLFETDDNPSQLSLAAPSESFIVGPEFRMIFGVLGSFLGSVDHQLFSGRQRTKVGNLPVMAC